VENNHSIQIYKGSKIRHILISFLTSILFVGFFVFAWSSIRHQPPLIPVLIVTVIGVTFLSAKRATNQYDIVFKDGIVEGPILQGKVISRGTIPVDQNNKIKKHFHPLMGNTLIIHCNQKSMILLWPYLSLRQINSISEEISRKCLPS
jgi:hypothetical protein